jgi:hypothetical protein
MKTIKLNASKPTLSQLLKRAEKENLVLCAGDDRVFVMAEIDRSRKQVKLVRESKELGAWLEEHFREGGKHTLAEVRKQLGIE